MYDSVYTVEKDIDVDRTTLNTSLTEHVIKPRPRGDQEGIGLHSLRAGTSIARERCVTTPVEGCIK
jgi:hypothetical protein